MQTGPLYATCVSCSFWFIVDAYFITTQREGGREGGRERCHQWKGLPAKVTGGSSWEI